MWKYGAVGFVINAMKEKYINSNDLNYTTPSKITLQETLKECNFKSGAMHKSYF